MELVTNSVAPRRWQTSRTPPNAGEMASTSILRVKIRNGSAKVRVGGPNDSREDMENSAMREKVWAGVIPVHTVLGEAVPAAYNVAGDKMPEYLDEWRREENEENERYAREVSGLKYPGGKKEQAI